MTKEKFKQELKKISNNNTFKVVQAFKKATGLTESSPILKRFTRRVMAYNVLNNKKDEKTTTSDLLFIYDSEVVRLTKN